MCYFMYAPTSEDEIQTCHTEMQDRHLIVRTNRVQIPTDEQLEE